MASADPFEFDDALRGRAALPSLRKRRNRGEEEPPGAGGARGGAERRRTREGTKSGTAPLLARRARRPPDSQLSDVVADSQDESDNSAGGASAHKSRRVQGGYCPTQASPEPEGGGWGGSGTRGAGQRDRSQGRRRRTREFDFSDDDELEGASATAGEPGGGKDGRAAGGALNLCRRNTHAGNPRKLVWTESAASRGQARGGGRMSARLESFMASPARGPLPLSPSPDPEELVSRAQAASPNGDSLGGRRAGGVGERFPEKEREKEKEKPDITKAAKFILEYSQITGKCKVLYLEKTVTVQAPRARSGAHDAAAIVRMVDGSADWLAESDDDDRSLLQSVGAQSNVGRVGAEEEMELGDLIQACGHQDNCLIFGLKELRNSLSSAGYRYWKQTDVEEIYLPATLQVKMSPQHKVSYTLRAASAANLWIVYCRRGALPCEFASEGGMIIDRAKYAPAPAPVKKARPKKVADPDQEKVRKPRASTNKGKAQPKGGGVVAGRAVLRKPVGNGRGKDVWNSDQDSDSDSAAGCDAPGARSSAEAQHERSVLEKLDRFMRRDDESGAPGNGAGGEGEGEQPQRSGHVVAAPASDDDDDWVTVKP